MRVSQRSEIITARFARIKSQGSQRIKIQVISFAIFANFAVKDIFWAASSLYYRFDKITVTIVSVFDNRMNPDRLKTEIG